MFFFGVGEKPQARGIFQNVGARMRHSLNPTQKFHILGVSLPPHYCKKTQKGTLKPPILVSNLEEDVPSGVILEVNVANELSN
jgi:hypothetical protein